MEGEDIFLGFFFDMIDQHKKGFYIDIGAHHPSWLSNTYFFYKKGWSGINIDPLPGCMSLFRKVRPRDINLEVAISDKKEILTYFYYDKPEYNTFSTELKDERMKSSSFDYLKLVGETKIQVFPLSEILEKHFPNGKDIDFISIDTEGLDLKVLKSNDWKKYVPKFILIECTEDLKIENIFNDDVYSFLKDKGYSLHGKTTYNVIYKKNNWPW